MPFWQSQQSLTMLQWAARTVVVYLWLMLITKLMGQREIGQTSLFDFIIAITIGSVAATPLGISRAGIPSTLLTVGLLGALQIVSAFLALKSARMRRVVGGEPLVLVQNGQLLEDTMRKARYNLEDLMRGLRAKNITSLSDVEFAILETNGKLSVIPKSQARPVTPRGLKLPTGYEGLASVLIEDGNIRDDNLRENNLSRDWLLSQLNQYGISDPKQVLAAVLDTQGRLFVSKMDQTNDEFVH